MPAIGDVFPDGFWAEARRRLKAAAGRPAWRALEELLGDPEFERAAAQEFPWVGRPEPGLSRRDFLKLMGASLAMAGLTACQPSREKIFPYLEQPEELLPGKPLFYATAHVRGGLARGAILKSNYGRPTKAEGNPDHPDSLGGTDAILQASVLELWDPERSQAPLRRGVIASWTQFMSEAAQALKAAGRGGRVRLLSGAVSSPTLLSSIARFKRAYPEARWAVFEPVGEENPLAGARLAFGRELLPRYELSRSDVIVALDCDLLLSEPRGLRHARHFAARRRPEAGPMPRLYCAEPTPSATGSVADHRLAVAPSRIPALAAAIARRCGFDVPAAQLDARESSWAAAAAADLRRSRGAGLLAAGRRQLPEVHALCAAVNAGLGAAGETVSYGQSPLAQGDLGLSELAGELSRGEVDVLLVLESNPVYAAPGGLDFAAALDRPLFSAHLGLYADETARACLWHVPSAHAYESWSDARAVDGTATIMQPLISPLYSGRSVDEFLLALLGTESPSHDIVKDVWLKGRSAAAGQDFWKESLNKGVVTGTVFPAEVPAVNAAAVRKAWRAEAPSAGLEYAVEPSMRVWDGRYADLAWLQELPDPATRQTWGEAVLFSPADADTLGLKEGDVVELALGGRRLTAPALALPGQARGCVTLRLGAGRTAGGDLAAGVGGSANAARLLDPTGRGFLPGLSVRKTGESEVLALTQLHHVMEGPPQVKAATLAEFVKNPTFAQSHAGDVSMFPPQPAGDYAWGMSIDLNSCIGCGACVVACQAENNIPTVGKDQVLAGREMHWIRIDRYYQGSPDAPAVYNQPLPCMQCEHAPCEYVCPVDATLHDAQGLNQMVYNRCVGTRFCSNNCPYKVRRFNFFGYGDDLSETEKLQRNPDVSVRSRGVMEKCTYCIQRINGARFQAELEDRMVRDGEIVPACAQACPAQAIVFGDQQNKKTAVAKLKESPRNYSVLEELGTRPRTTYLARVTNPNPDLETGE